MIFNIYLILLSEDILTFTSNVDPDEMQHYAAFHRGLHCLQNYPYKEFCRIQRVEPEFISYLDY